MRKILTIFVCCLLIFVSCDLNNTDSIENAMARKDSRSLYGVWANDGTGMYFSFSETKLNVIYAKKSYEFNIDYSNENSFKVYKEGSSTSLEFKWSLTKDLKNLTLIYPDGSTAEQEKISNYPAQFNCTGFWYLLNASDHSNRLMYYEITTTKTYGHFYLYNNSGSTTYQCVTGLNNETRQLSVYYFVYVDSVGADASYLISTQYYPNNYIANGSYFVYTGFDGKTYLKTLFDTYSYLSEKV